MQPDLFSSAFEYIHVDGIARAYARGNEPNLANKSFHLDELGPLVELHQLGNEKIISKIENAEWLDKKRHLTFVNARRNGTPIWTSPNNLSGGAIGTCLQDEAIINSFKIDAHKAALNAKFSSPIAARFVAAFGELIGNIVDHSELISSGYIAFNSRVGMFEFIVSDRGIGVLNSIRKCDDYKFITDHSTALRRIIETGVSRYGPNTGHGNGFRPIFEKLADMQGHLRFRSGDQALVLDGRFGDIIKVQISQKAPIQGFFASVVCNVTQ